MCGGIEAEPVMLGQTIGGQIQTDQATSTDVVLMINRLSVCLFVCVVVKPFHFIMRLVVFKI